MRIVTITDERRLVTVLFADLEHRLFDAARIRLWLAEKAGGSAPDLDAASATFDELGAHPYAEGASRAAAEA